MTTFQLSPGKGKKLFDKGPIPAAFKLEESTITPRGVIIAYYKRAGKVRTAMLEHKPDSNRVRVIAAII